MVRTWDPTPVPPEVIDTCLAAALHAPSAGFSQGWDFVVLTAQADRDAFWRAATPADAPPRPDAAVPGPARDGWAARMRRAPALVVCLSDPDRYLDRYAEPDKGRTDRDPGTWAVPYWDVDTGMAALLLQLTAQDHALGACFFGVPAGSVPAVLETLGAPAARRVVGVVALGRAGPDDRRSPSLARGRRPLDEVAHDGRFGRPWVSPGDGTAECRD